CHPPGAAQRTPPARAAASPRAYPPGLPILSSLGGAPGGSGQGLMRLIRGLRNLRESHWGSVVTVGTFDGIHLGHRALIERVIEHGRRLGRPTMMLTFEPMPREHLVP